MNSITLGDLMGEELEDEFLKFDLTEIQSILSSLQTTDAIDIAHIESLQQQTLRGADLIAEFLGKIVKTTSYLESKLNSIKNKIALEFKPTDGVKLTADMRKLAGESSPEVEMWSIKLAKAKGSKIVLEKKYDILIKSHHHFKDIANNMKRTLLGPIVSDTVKTNTGWE